MRRGSFSSVHFARLDKICGVICYEEEEEKKERTGRRRRIRRRKEEERRDRFQKKERR